MGNKLFHQIRQLRRRLRPTFRRTLRTARKIKQAQPLTIRGFIAIALSAAALQFIAADESDLIAYMLGGGVAAMLLLALVTSLLVRRRLAKILRIEPHFDREGLYSRSPVRAGLTVRNALLPPFFSLHVNRVFQHDLVECPEHVISGKEAVRRVVDTIRFPHRGFWTLDHLSLSLRDALGFTEISWEMPAEVGVEVSARNIQIRSLPIVAASSRSGDTLDQAKERAGDLFDIKQYDPSDGVKRILWKVYAKTGAVVVRRPEPAIIPEGEVAVYLIANRNDDHVAGALQSYLAQLENNSITILFGTDGSGAYRTSYHSSHHEGAATSDEVVATTPEKISAMINRSVWSAHAGTGRDLEQFFAGLANLNRVIRRVVVFAPENDTKWFDHVRNIAAANHAALTIVLAPDSLDPAVDLNLRMRKAEQKTNLWLKRVEKSFKPEKVSSSASLLNAIAAGQSGSTELLLCEPSV
ncbi:MAG: DUF58 domain-containing protein [Bdellovibrionales bacterium]|nr:DUF58 domain-containing protein [Bdellovibrionales bacterium]